MKAPTENKPKVIYAGPYKADLYASAHKVACPACCGGSGSPRFVIDCRYCGNEGVVTEQKARDFAPSA